MTDMTNAEKFYRMVSILNQDDRLKQRLLDDPEELLKSLNLDNSVLNEAHNPEAISRANSILSAAKLTEADDAVSSLKKLKAASSSIFSDVGLDIDPFGFKLMERPTNVAALDVTASGTIKCKLNPSDGCSPDVDF